MSVYAGVPVCACKLHCAHLRAFRVRYYACACIYVCVCVCFRVCICLFTRVLRKHACTRMCARKFHHLGLLGQTDRLVKGDAFVISGCFLNAIPTRWDVPSRFVILIIGITVDYSSNIMSHS